MEKFFSLSELRRELGIPIILVKKLIIWGQIKVIQSAEGTITITETELLKAKELVKHPWSKSYLFFKALGPGIITGASDDDPSGIGTYSSVGAQFGYKLIWMAPYLLPLMIAVQETCARIGVVTNQGLASVLKRRYSKIAVIVLVLLLVIANTINIGADLQAMAASVQLMVSVKYIYALLGITVLIVLLELTIPYKNYAKLLKWLTLSLFAYIITGFIIHPDWISIFKEAIVPDIRINKDFIFAMVAVFGTTISPYLFFWQTSEEVEEYDMECAEPGPNMPKKKRVIKMRNDVFTGMIFANIAFLFIVITTAEVLFKNGIMAIGTPQEAALALKPLAGDYAFILFALGIIGTGLLAVPVLAGSSAYAIAEVFGWQEGLEKKFWQAKGFYLVILVSVVLGFLMNFIGISPMQGLYYAAYVNGVLVVPLIFVIMKLGNDKKLMGNETHPKWIKFFGWLAFFFAAAAVITTLILFFV